MVYFEDHSELKELNVAPVSTPIPTLMPVVTPTPTPVATIEPTPQITPTPVGAEDKITVTIDGEVLEFVDQSAQIINNRTLVPMRAIFEKLGASVQWLHEYRMVVADTALINITMKIDEATYYVNGEAKTLDVPAQILNDRTMIPARAVAESLGCKVEWNQETKTVIITTKDHEKETEEVVTEQAPLQEDID